MDAKDRKVNLADRTLSCRVTDLGVTFMTKLSADGAGEVHQVPDGAPAAQIRFSASSDQVLGRRGRPRHVRARLADREAQGRGHARPPPPPQAALGPRRAAAGGIPSAAT